jgi:hypothetical protein
MPEASKKKKSDEDILEYEDEEDAAEDEPNFEAFDNLFR